jgi:hypothetical protein
MPGETSPDGRISKNWGITQAIEDHSWRFLNETKVLPTGYKNSLNPTNKAPQQGKTMNPA